MISRRTALIAAMGAPLMALCGCATISRPLGDAADPQTHYPPVWAPSFPSRTPSVSASPVPNLNPKPSPSTSLGGRVFATGATFAQAAADAFIRLLPTVSPSHQPEIAIVNVPTLFATNADRAQTYRQMLLGRRVTFTVRAIWTWDFGDGTAMTTTNAGGTYPDTSVSHAYAKAGAYTVNLTTTWTGAYSIDGGPATPIAGGPIPRQSKPFVVEAREAYGVLGFDGRPARETATRREKRRRRRL